MSQITTPQDTKSTRSGSFISLWGLVLLSLAFGGVGMFFDALDYSQVEPTVVESRADLAKLADGDFAVFKGTLDYEHAILSDKAVGDAYLMAPVAGTDFTFWVSMKDGIIPQVAEELSFEGRVTARDGATWEIGDARDLDLTYHSKKLYSVETPKSALVLRDGLEPGDDMTEAWVIGAISLLILFVWIRRVFAFLASFVRPDASVTVA